MTNTKVQAGEKVDEEKIIAVLKDLGKKIGNPKEQLWRPTVFIHDGELDDVSCWILLKHMSSQQKTTLSVHLQLPSLEAGDEKAKALDAVHTKFERVCKQVFRDKDSSNTDAILAVLS